MRFIHLADLHIGKRLNDFSLLEEQHHILNQILAVADSENVDAVVIAGDVYDKSTPGTEAVLALDTFLCELSRRKKHVYLIAGNHDSPERLFFGSRLMEKSGLHISPVYNGTIAPLPFKDEFGTVNFYLLPFIKPAHVNAFLADPEQKAETYTDAVNRAITEMNVNMSERNVLVAHQFVTGSSRCDSEEISVGGTDNVDAWVFDDFDYVALGHIHSPQKIGRNEVRYSGTPLKYSFSEVNHKKSVCLVDILEKGTVKTTLIPLQPLHDMKEIKGNYATIIEEFAPKTETGQLLFPEIRDEATGTQPGGQASSGSSITDDFIHITLTDEDDIPDALANLRRIFPRLLRLDYDNTRTRQFARNLASAHSEKVHPLSLFAEFYEKQNNTTLTEEQNLFMKQLIEEIDWSQQT